MNDKGTSGGAETFDAVVTRILDAPVEEVWKAWSDPKYVTLGGQFRVGGKLRGRGLASGP